MSTVLQRDSERRSPDQPVDQAIPSLALGEEPAGSTATVDAVSSAVSPLGPMTQRRVLGLAIPIIGENLLHTLVGTVDTLMVAQLGKAEVAGVGASLELIFFILAALSAVSIGATVMVAQAIGAGDRERANAVARQALVWGLLLAIPVSVAGYLLAGPAIGLFGAEADVTHYGTVYLQIVGATSVTLLLTFVCGAILRGAGDSRTPFLASIVANVVNVVVAWLLIFGKLGMPELGVAGSAWGATTGRAAGAAILLVLLAGGKRAVSVRGRVGWRPERTVARRLMALGVPTALEELLISAGFMLMLAVVALLGTAALAAQHIAFTALSLIFMPGFGFAMAATALVGQAIGARDLTQARTAARLSVTWATIWMSAGGLVYFVFAPQAMRFFSDDPAVIADGVDALRVLAPGLPFWALWTVFGGSLRGSGDTRTPMLMSGLCVWLALALAWVAVRWFDGGIGAVWFMFLISAPLAGLGNWWVLRRRLASGTALREATPVVAGN
jgi:putative MATE family efflux protein